MYALILTFTSSFYFSFLEKKKKTSLSFPPEIIKVPTWFKMRFDMHSVN